MTKQNTTVKNADSTHVDTVNMGRTGMMNKEEQKMIRLEDIRADNPDVVSALINQGYALVTHAFLEQCNRESAELVRLKMTRRSEERGKALWEEET